MNDSNDSGGPTAGSTSTGIGTSASVVIAAVAPASLALFLIATLGLAIPSVQAGQEAQHYEESGTVEQEDDAMMSQYLSGLAAAGLGTYTREDDVAEEFSIERAKSFMDNVAVSWGNKFRCVTCHTNGFYLTSPASYFKNRPGYLQTRKQARDYVRSWPKAADVHEDDTNIKDTYVVATAAFLAISELQTGNDLSDSTVAALDRAWSLQAPEGHWPKWIVCNWPPFESDYHFGVTLMAIVGGMAPDSYMETEAAREGMARIRRYLAENEAVHVQNRGMLLWAAGHVEGLVTEKERGAWIRELRELQRLDGGWASGNLGAWRQRTGKDSDDWVDVESDGYGTGFAMFVLMKAGVPASDPSIQRGVDWLRANQRARGYWWTQSLRNNPETPNFLTHAGTTFALKALEAAGVR
jgi:squalene-hopene/tetraprenyl-beta-curcumene cyclase